MSRAVAEAFDEVRRDARTREAEVARDRRLRRLYHRFRGRFPWRLLPRRLLPRLFGWFGDLDDVPPVEELRERIAERELTIARARSTLYSDPGVSRASS